MHPLLDGLIFQLKSGHSMVHRLGHDKVPGAAAGRKCMALALSSIPGSNNADRVLIATLLSFVLCPVIVILVFSTRSAMRAWVGLGLTAVLMSAIIVTLKMALL